MKRFILIVLLIGVLLLGSGYLIQRYNLFGTNNDVVPEATATAEPVVKPADNLGDAIVEPIQESEIPEKPSVEQEEIPKNEATVPDLTIKNDMDFEAELRNTKEKMSEVQSKFDETSRKIQESIDAWQMPNINEIKLPTMAPINFDDVLPQATLPPMQPLEKPDGLD